ncbi:MAG: endonuclease MutS2, partial [Deltaproteobacteria bacterium]
MFLWLTDLVRGEVSGLESAFAALTEVDVLHAKVQLARKHRCSKPHFGGVEVRLRTARHPLLLATGKPVVPIDLLIPAGKSGLIITGPNTGGKTAALKTLGLLCLMAQSGLLVPVAEESCLPLFHGIFADIGDAQSLEQSLSTFSAHVRNVTEILSDLVAPALVLFDEPGGGTDPVEGGALACGLLTYLKERGVHVAASTHLTPVKLFALADGAYQVAAVEFDLDTLTPHYRLRYDTVGQSLGLPMARRLGLPEEVCTAAEA